MSNGAPFDFGGGLRSDSAALSRNWLIEAVLRRAALGVDLLRLRGSRSFSICMLTESGERTLAAAIKPTRTHVMTSVWSKPSRFGLGLHCRHDSLQIPILAGIDDGGPGAHDHEEADRGEPNSSGGSRGETRRSRLSAEALRPEAGPSKTERLE